MTRSARRRVRAGLLLTVAGLLAAAPGAVLSGAAGSAPTTITLHGRGNGHGVGMPQDGALALGRSGATARRILDTFYPGTEVTKAAGAHVHVAVWLAPSTGTPETRVVLPAGGTVSAGGRSAGVPAGGGVTLTQLPGGAQSWSARVTPAAAPAAGRGGRSVPLLARADPDPGATTAPADESAPGNGTPAGDATASDGATTGAGTTPSSAPPADASSDPGAGTAPAPAGTQPGTAAPAPATTRHPATTGTGTGTTTGTTARGTSAATSSGRPAATLTSDALRITPAAGGTVTVTSTGRSYRGSLVTAPGALVDDITIEQYLLGLGEVRDPTWPAASLQALVIAARTYALRDALGAHDSGDPQHVNICATDACQVYLGAGVEYPQLTAAVRATDHLVVTYDHQLAETFYSASAGGRTATPAEGFGPAATALPYLTPVSYAPPAPDGWALPVPLTTAGAALGYPGALTGIEVTARGPSGRVTQVVLHGSVGDQPETGQAVAAALGLRSTLFETGSGLADPAIDEALAGGAGEQLLPALTPLSLSEQSLGDQTVPLPVLAPELDGVAAGVPVSGVSVGVQAGPEEQSVSFTPRLEGVSLAAAVDDNSRRVLGLGIAGVGLLLLVSASSAAVRWRLG